ncbi:MAG TPA: magnesium/cobalt transporter CorA [Gammaproteobacteria bacterium]|nr:magnesium/cobalt transporter CorA [Gammaproteobacteria bacterium]
MARNKRARRQAQPGSPPGHPIESVAADVAGTTVSWRRYNETVMEERTETALDAAPAALDPAVVDWLHFPSPPDPGALRWLHERLGLDPLALEDVHNGNQRTKLELYDKHSFMVVSVPVVQDEELSLEQFSLFLGPHWVITFWSGDRALVEPVMSRLRSGSGRIRKRGADYLFYCLVDSAVDAGFPVLENLRDRIEALEDELLERPDESAILRIHELRRKLALMRRLALPGQEALAHLLRSDDSPLSAPTRRYIRDVLDHHMRIGDTIDNLAEVTRSLHELHLMSVSHRMNDVMKLLTIIATIFIPLTFIAGIYGMNFDPDASPWNMPELRARYGYPLVMLLFAAIGIGMAWMFRRRGWF